jgi:PAS domain S-box-containing protein
MARGASVEALLPTFDLLGIAAYRLDADGTVGAANDTCCRWLGRPRDEVIGRTIGELAPPAAAEAVLASLANLTDDPSVRLIHGDRMFSPVDGQVRRTRFLATAERGNDGRFLYAVVSVIDLDGPGIREVAPPVSPPHAAALRISAAHHLGPRLEEMLVLLATGHRITTMATTLHLAEGTVRNRISELSDALGVRGQSAIVTLVQAEVASYADAAGSVKVSPR